MHSSQTAQSPEPSSFPRQALRFVAALARNDVTIMIGLPLLIAVGAILGVINLLALIHVIAVLIGG